MCSSWRALFRPWRQRLSVWGRLPTSVLLHQCHEWVELGSPARHMQGAEGVLCGGHHQHRCLDLGHVVDRVVARHLICQAGQDPVLPPPLHMTSHASAVRLLHARACAPCASGMQAVPIAGFLQQLALLMEPAFLLVSLESHVQGSSSPHTCWGVSGSRYSAPPAPAP